MPDAEPGRRLETALARLDQALRIIAGASLALVFLLIIVQVLMRYLLHTVPFFMEEAARYLCIWGVFSGVASGIYQGTHIRVTILQRLFCKAGKSLALLLEGSCAGLYALLAVSGYKLALFLHLERSIAMGIPLSVPAAALPVFFTAACIIAMVRVCQRRPGL